MKPAPNFELPNQDGKIVRLSDFRGKWLVLYFYPKDDTPGCTKEACNFRDEREAIAEIGNAVIVGVSKDSVASHKKFVQKYNLNFDLLSDESTEVIASYGAWQLKKFMGREYMGIVRSTVIIDPNGYVVKEYPKVDPKKHADQIITDLKNFQSKQ